MIKQTALIIGVTVMLLAFTGKFEFLNQKYDTKSQLRAAVTEFPTGTDNRSRASATPSATPTTRPSATPTQTPNVQKIRKTLNAKVSYYGYGKNADGTAFDPSGNTCACWSEYPKGTRFRVSYKGKSVIVVCNDRGHFKELGRFLDLSTGAFSRIAPTRLGVVEAFIEVLE